MFKRRRQCRFIIGWMDGSDSACDPTGIHTQEDLLLAIAPDFGVLCNDRVADVFEYDAPEGFEWEVGASYAFRQGFTAHDSLSIAQYQDSEGKWISV